jgi:hypothetical protein
VERVWLYLRARYLSHRMLDDQLAAGKKIRVPTVLDTFSRYVPALDPRISYSGEDVVATLERVCGQIGYPRRSGLIRARSSCRGIWTFGRTRRA